MTGAKKFTEALMAKLAVTGAIPAAAYRVMLPHERHIATTRQHPAVLLGPCVLTFAGLVAAAILSGLAGGGRGDLLPTVWAVWLALVLRLMTKVAHWISSFFVVTSTRIIMVSGLLRIKVDIIPLNTVNDIKINRTLGGRLFGCSDFTIACEAPDQIIYKIAYMPEAERIYLRIVTAIFPPESVPCPVCHGEGTEFRPPTDDGAPPSDCEASMVPENARHAEELLKAGYQEVECALCRGRGIVPASDSDD